MPRCWNWQTGWFQEPVPFYGSVGSTPTRGTFSFSYEKNNSCQHLTPAKRYSLESADKI